MAEERNGACKRTFSNSWTKERERKKTRRPNDFRFVCGSISSWLVSFRTERNLTWIQKFLFDSLTLCIIIFSHFPILSICGYHVLLLCSLSACIIYVPRSKVHVVYWVKEGKELSNWKFLMELLLVTNIPFVYGLETRLTEYRSLLQTRERTGEWMSDQWVSEGKLMVWVTVQTSSWSACDLQNRKKAVDESFAPWN